MAHTPRPAPVSLSCVQDMWAHFFIIVCHEMASHTPRTQEGAELSVLRSLDLSGCRGVD